MAFVPSVPMSGWARWGVLPLLGATLALGCVTTEGEVEKVEMPPPPATPCQIATTWQNNIAYAADPIHGGKPTQGFLGRLYLFGQSIGYPMNGDGSVLVELFDETNGTSVKREQWEIDPQTLARLIRKDFIGWGYTLFLPSGEYKPGMTTLRLRTCYLPAKGGKLYTESEVTIAAGNGSTHQSNTSGPPMARK
jgi:hypothetical protein